MKCSTNNHSAFFLNNLIRMEVYSDSVCVCVYRYIHINSADVDIMTARLFFDFSHFPHNQRNQGFLSLEIPLLRTTLEWKWGVTSAISQCLHIQDLSFAMHHNSYV